MSCRPAASILLFVLAGLALLLAGSFYYRQEFLTRGIPEELPGSVAHAGPQLGINVYLQDLAPDELNENLAQIQALGIQAIKQPFYYDDDFDWQAAEQIVNAAATHELQLVPLLDGSPAQNFAPPADPAQFAIWAGDFAARFGDSVQHYIIWDEPNLSSHWGGKDSQRQ